MVAKNTDKILIIIIVAIIAALAYKKDKINQLALVGPSSIEENLEESADENQSEEPIRVHILGEIKNPGVYELDVGMRMEDLVKMAGGYTDRALSDEVNLAMKLEDEMMVRIPSLDDEGARDLNMSGLVDVSPNMSSKININTATKDELKTLSGIGDKTADKIISYRENNKFKEIEDIKKVSGIGDKIFDDIKDEIRVR